MVPCFIFKLDRVKIPCAMASNRSIFRLFAADDLGSELIRAFASLFQGSASSEFLHAAPTHVLLVADPQVSSPRRSAAWRRWLRLTDISLRKRWSYARRVKPDVVVFLGDMLNDGRSLGNDE